MAQDATFGRFENKGKSIAHKYVYDASLDPDGSSQTSLLEKIDERLSRTGTPTMWCIASQVVSIG